MRAKKQEITLTLDMAFDLCLEQWNWIKAEIETGSNIPIEELKGQWCRENGFDAISKNAAGEPRKLHGRDVPTSSGFGKDPPQI